MVAGNNYTSTMSTINGTGVTYQWYKNDIEIAGATSNTLTINNAQQSDLGDYTCKASSPIVTDLQIERNTIHLYGTVNPTDRAALVALYNATNGANWTDNTNWNTANKVYTWYGVSMVGDRVSKIELSNNNLVGTIPGEIGDLTELKTLDLSQNINYYNYNGDLHGSIPPEIGNLTNLEELIINFANLSGNIPVEIGNCTALKELELWHNQLTGTIPNELGNLVNLETITLEYNQLTGTIPASFANCTKMGSFWLNGNQLTGDVPDIFTNMSDLYYVSLFSNQLTGNVDLSNNPAVYGIWMGNLLLSSIDLRNGNNTIMSYFYTNNNPNLTCIFVDDAAYSTANWTYIDATTTFVETQAQCDALSVNDELESLINIYPNPTNGILNLDIPAEITIRNISIQSITGQVVQKLNAKDLRASSSRFDISQLPKGVYFVQIETQKGELANYRIIKE
jgi:Leucine-rich repeat (LRR) protein